MTDPPDANVRLRSDAAPPVWLFGLTNIPFGVAGGYTSVAMPFILRQAGVPLATIAAVSAAVLLPLSWQFLWAPALDFGPRRRTWLILTAALASVLLGFSLFLDLPSQLLPFEICCVLGQGFSGLVSSSNGALVATLVPGERHGRASGWLNAANLGGNAAGGGLILGIAQGFSPQAAGLALGLLSFAPALAVLAVRETPRPPSRTFHDAFTGMLGELRRAASSRSGWTGILFCIAPVSTPALLDLFSAVADDYHAPGRTVEYTMGYGSGLATVIGALLGGRILDRLNRRRAYLWSGAAIAVVDLAMAQAPLTPLTYVVGATLYSLVAGFCFAAFSAMVLEIIGKAGRSAAAQYTLFDAAGNFATSYLAWTDGWGYGFAKAHGASGASGLLATDAAMNLAGAAALALLMLAVLPRPRIARA